MTHADLYPCTSCGRENLYPGPCASCEHRPLATFDPAPACAGFNPCDGSGGCVLRQWGDPWDPAAVAAVIKPAALELGRRIVLPRSE